MIQLTRLNNTVLGVNSDLIKFVESSPDTVITLTTGDKLVVQESFEEISRKVLTFKQSLFVDARSMEGPRYG